MAASYNKVILVGNLTRDPEVRYTPGGSAVCEIGLAVSRQWFDKNANERKEETTFVDVTLWGRQAEVAGEYLSKGRSVLIDGRLQLDTWDDRETGKKRSKLRVVGESMTMLGSGQGGAQAEGAEATRAEGSGAAADNGRRAPSQTSYDSGPADYDDGPSNSGGGFSDEDVPF
ncbi:MAG: single-stranded DNA-binding protein [Planctomycetaceae bacterium]